LAPTSHPCANTGAGRSGLRKPVRRCDLRPTRSPVAKLAPRVGASDGRPGPAPQAHSRRTGHVDVPDRPARFSLSSIEQWTTSEATSDWISGTPGALCRAAFDEAPECWSGAVRWLNVASWSARSRSIARSSSTWLITCHSPRRTTATKNPQGLREPRRNARSAAAKNRRWSAEVYFARPVDAASSNSASLRSTLERSAGRTFDNLGRESPAFPPRIPISQRLAGCRFLDPEGS